jgi:hypothetical protein
VFKDSSFAGLTVTELSDNFPLGGVGASLLGDTLTLSFAGHTTETAGTSHLASYQFSGFTAAVPEPGTWALMGLGLIALSVTRRRPASPSTARHCDGASAAM